MGFLYYAIWNHLAQFDVLGLHNCFLKQPCNRVSFWTQCDALQKVVLFYQIWRKADRQSSSSVNPFTSSKVPRNILQGHFSRDLEWWLRMLSRSITLVTSGESFFCAKRFCSLLFSFEMRSFNCGGGRTKATSLLSKRMATSPLWIFFLNTS